MNYVSNIGLVVSALLLVVVIIISAYQRLGITRDFIIASIRGAVQLTLLALVIQAVFTVQGPLLSIGVLLAMVILASRVSSRYAKEMRFAWLIVAAALAGGAAVSLFPLVAVGAVDAAPRFLIPLGGIIIGNTMNASSIFFHRYFAEERHRSVDRTEEGGVRRAAFREALRASLIPAIDSTKMSGLIFLPGIFLGMILAGESPLAAIKIQIVILYVVLSSYCLVCFSLGWMVMWSRRRVASTTKE
jgi:putative ABC transport system permease protein